MRDALLFLHIAGVAGWLGGGLHGLVTQSNIAGLGAPQAGEAMRGLERRNSVYFGVTSLLILLTGIGLVLVSDAYDWSDTFILIGFGAFVVSGVLQSLIGRKANERLVEAGTSGSNIGQALRSWQQASIWDLLVLFVTVWAMVTKLGS